MHDINRPRFIKIEYKGKAALIDPENLVCLGVSKNIADHMDEPSVQAKIMPIWQQQAKLQKKIKESRPSINTMYLMVTRKCNMDCKFCAIRANQNMDLSKEITATEVRDKVIPFLEKNQPHKLIVTGGEPLVKRELIEIINLLSSRVQCRITLQSNGLLMDERIIKELKGKIYEIDFSIAHMVGEERKRKKLIDNIELCKANGIQAALSFVYEGDNEQKLFDAIDIAAKYNTMFLLSIVAPVGRAIENNRMLNDYEKISMYVDIAKYILDKGYENTSVADIFYSRVQERKNCGGYGKVMAIFPEGDIYMCQSLEERNYRIGNVLDDSPEQLLCNLNDKLNLPAVKQAFCADYKNICNSCNYRYLCGGKCPVSGDQDDYDCVLVKALLNFSLFYFDTNESMKENLKKYIDFFEQVKTEFITSVQEEKIE